MTADTPAAAGTSEASMFEQEEGVDWLLAFLVNLGAQSGTEIAITLTAGGATISGVLIPGRTYFSEVSKVLASASPGHGSVEIRDAIATAFEQMMEVHPAPSAGSLNLTEIKPHYVHLRDAHIIEASGKTIPTGPGTHWRGKLSDISGFMLGQMKAS